MTGRITNQANQYGKDVEAYQVVAYLIQCLGNMFFYRLFTDFHLGGYFFIPQVLFAAQLVDRPALGRRVSTNRLISSVISFSRSVSCWL